MKPESNLQELQLHQYSCDWVTSSHQVKIPSVFFGDPEFFLRCFSIFFILPNGTGFSQRVLQQTPIFPRVGNLLNGGVARLLRTTWTITPYPPWNSHFLTLKMDTVGISRSFPFWRMLRPIWIVCYWIVCQFQGVSYLAHRIFLISKKSGALSFPKWPVGDWIPNPLNISVFGVPIVLGRSVVLRQIGCFGFFEKRMFREDRPLTGWLGDS